MNKQNLRLKIEQLPLRTRQLTNEDLKQLFGGGGRSLGDHCSTPSDCAQYECGTGWFGLKKMCNANCSNSCSNKFTPFDKCCSR